MDYLREDHLRGFAQIDPLVAYKNEGGMFEALMNSIWEEFARLIFHVEVEVAPRARSSSPPWRPVNVGLSGGAAEAALGTGPGGGRHRLRCRRRRRAGDRGWRRTGNGAPTVYEQETVVKDDAREDRPQ